MPFGRDTGIIQGYLLRTSRSLSPLSGTDSASIIPEIGFGDGGVGGVYILYVRVHLNGDRNGECHPCDLRAPSSYGDSKQQPGPNGACKFASCRDRASGTMMGPLSDLKPTFISSKEGSDSSRNSHRSFVRNKLGIFAELIFIDL